MRKLAMCSFGSSLGRPPNWHWFCTNCIILGFNPKLFALIVGFFMYDVAPIRDGIA